MTSIRGAITVPENTSQAILTATEELLHGIMEENQLSIEEIVDIIFTATQDLDAVYPAAAARTMGIVDAGLFCVQEMSVPGSLPRCIRVLLHVQQQDKLQKDMRHVYLKDAVKLRPDLFAKSIAKPPLTVAIDGPSGAGKSTAAKGVAAALGIVYIDTGAMYRAVALYCLRQGIELNDRNAVEEKLASIAIDIRHNAGEQRLLLNNEDVTTVLRSQEVAEGSSVVAAYPAVRAKLVSLQQALAAKRSVVMDGRDIGSHVLPGAQVKIFLTAGTEERVKRRMSELRQRDLPADFDAVRQEMLVRDKRDAGREASPLVRADGAVEINSDGMSREQIVAEILKLVQEGA